MNDPQPNDAGNFPRRNFLMTAAAAGLLSAPVVRDADAGARNTPAESGQVKKALQPRDIPARWTEHLAAGDLDGLVTLFHPDCVLFFPPGPAKRGRDTIRELLKGLVASGGSFSYKVTGEIVNGDTGLTQVEHRLVKPDGSVVGGNSTEVVKKMADGAWVYYIDCPMGPPPPA